MTAVTPESDVCTGCDTAGRCTFMCDRPAPPPATDEVVEVLRPFAEAADSYDDEREEWPLFEVHDILVGHLRAARSLLAKLEVRG